MNVVSILREKGKEKTRPCDVFDNEVGVYDRQTLRVKAIKVDGRWRFFILNFIIDISTGLSSLILHKMYSLSGMKALFKLSNS